MKQRNQVLFLVVSVAVLGFLWLRGGEGVGFGGMGDRGNEKTARFGPSDIPELAGASPGKTLAEDFNRGDRDLFDYSESPKAIAARLAAIKRKEAEAAEKRRKAEAKRRADAEAKLLRDAEAKRLREAEAERLRLKRLEDAEWAKNNPPKIAPPPAPVPPNFPYLYEGLIGPREGAVAILRTKEKMKLAYAQAGQVLDEAFRIERVGQLNLTFSFTDPVFTGVVRRVPLRPNDRSEGAKPEKDRDIRSRRTSR